jgi:hypothetical protein
MLLLLLRSSSSNAAPPNYLGASPTTRYVGALTWLALYLGAL